MGNMIHEQLLHDEREAHQRTREMLEERTLQHKTQLDNAIRLLFAIERAMEQAKEEGHHKYRGTDEETPFFSTLRAAANGQ